MTIELPTPQQLKEVADQLGLNLDDEDVETFRGLMGPNIEAFNQVDDMPDELPLVKYPREPGYRPEPEDNPLNGWYYKTSIKGADDGKLSGRSVALKDNIMLAGVPMMNGSATLEGYVPEVDATLVERILDAGGEIAGKSSCEFFCLSGGSHTNSTGPTHNPYRHGFSAGGSSSGSAALVSSGSVDMAVGGDQGGSIRIPASFCGVYGMKPTYGLVPYTGVMPLEVTVDHVGPMTNNIADNALLLEVIAGPDGYDPRQNYIETQDYTRALNEDVKGIKIGVVTEGFGHANSEDDVDDCVRAAAAHFQSLGARVEEVSIPTHLDAQPVAMPILTYGVLQTMLAGDGFGGGRSDLYVTSLMHFHRGWRARINEFSDNAKLFALSGSYVTRRYGMYHYGKSVNISRRLRAAYDAVLDEYDLLLMPTLPIKATPLPGPDASREEKIGRAMEMFANTVPFDITHHPSMSIPCGLRDGLPIGLMMIAKHFDEPSIYRAAHAFEQSRDWKSM
ncbi:MAG: Asp-tRNA(Asn)/Glu-tRNA(Gln) amidotransferase GatCAB subunit A [Gammaproteobacteria bacterium]|nr:Asp-tRNA(Asn)/Glu-tRNA(Gln) amidotransferase GatCAB subunit A [Gammaproteobacteria bacterium]